MRKILLVGGEPSFINQSFCKKLKKLGLSTKWHWDWDTKPNAKTIPKYCEGVVFLKNMVGHSLADTIVAEARKRNIPFIHIPSKYSLAYAVLKKNNFILQVKEVPVNSEWLPQTNDNGELRYDLAPLTDSINLFIEEEPTLVLHRETFLKKIQDFVTPNYPETLICNQIEAKISKLEGLSEVEQTSWMLKFLNSKDLNFLNMEEILLPKKLQNLFNSLASEFLSQRIAVSTAYDFYVQQATLKGESSVSNSTFRRAVYDGLINGGKEETRWYSTRHAVLEYIRNPVSRKNMSISSNSDHEVISDKLSNHDEMMQRITELEEGLNIVLDKISGFMQSVNVTLTSYQDKVTKQTDIFSKIQDTFVGVASDISKLKSSEKSQKVSGLSVQEILDSDCRIILEKNKE